MEREYDPESMRKTCPEPLPLTESYLGLQLAIHDPSFPHAGLQQ